jgi:capsular polysaccharide transport system permease protein
LEDIVRQDEPRVPAQDGADKPRKGRQRADDGTVVRLGVSRLTNLVGQAPKQAPASRETMPPGDDLGKTAKAPLRLPQPSRSQAWAVWISLAICVALPTFLATVYYGFIAANQYVSEFRFSVRAGDGRPPDNAYASSVSSAAQTRAIYDNFIVVDFVRSRQAVDSLEREVGLRRVFSSDHADFWARIDKDASAEDLVRYWDSMVESAFDMVSGIAAVKVRAFTPEEAHQVATRLMKLSEALVNEVNMRARRDAIRFAEEDLKRAEERLRHARRAVRDFRSTMRSPDPTLEANATFTLANKMREEIARLNTELSRALGSMSANAPTVMVLREKLKATEDQLKLVENRFGDEPTGTKELLPVQLAQYEDLEVERLFAEKLYHSVLTTLESARSNANMQHTYVAAFVEPARPQVALYPQRLLSILIVLVVSGMIWSSGLLIVYAIKDHAV